MTIRIALADDHAVVRAGYRRLLACEPTWNICAEYEDGESAYNGLVKLSETENPADILLLDLSMPGRGGLATLQRLKSRLPKLRILIFSMHDSEALIRQALRSGAQGFLSKNSSPEILMQSIDRIMSGEVVLQDEWLHLLENDEVMSSSIQQLHLLLSPKEFEVFILLAQGLSVEVIANRLYLSIKTVANYQTSVRKKTGLNNAVDMYRYAIEHHLMEA